MWASKENNTQKNRKRIRRLLSVWSQDISITFLPHPKVFFLSYLFEDKRVLAFCPLQSFTNFYPLTFLSDTAGIPTRVLNHLLPVLGVSLSLSLWALPPTVCQLPAAPASQGACQEGKLPSFTPRSTSESALRCENYWAMPLLHELTSYSAPWVSLQAFSFLSFFK